MKNTIANIIDLSPTVSKNKSAYIIFVSDVVEKPLQIAPMGLFNALREILNDPRSEIKIFNPEQKKEMEDLLQSLEKTPNVLYTVCCVQIPSWFAEISCEEIANLKEKQKNPFNFSFGLDDIYGAYFSNEPDASFYNMDNYPHAVHGEKRIEGFNSDDTEETIHDSFWTMEARMLAKCRANRYREG